MSILGNIRGIEAAAVVLDDEPDLLGGGDEPDVYTLGLGMPGNVGEGFLADAIQGYLDARWEWAAAVYRHVERADSRLLLPPLYQGFERHGERASFEWG